MSKVATNLSFEDKMRSRIKDGIGDLISDDELTKLVNRGVEEVFFTRRPNPAARSYGSREPETLAPLLHSIVSEALQPAVNKAVAAYIAEHNDEMIKAIKDVVTDGVGNAVVKAMNSQFQSQLLTFQLNMENALRGAR